MLPSSHPRNLGLVKYWYASAILHTFYFSQHVCCILTPFCSMLSDLIQEARISRLKQTFPGFFNDKVWTSRFFCGGTIFSTGATFGKQFPGSQRTQNCLAATTRTGQYVVPSSSSYFWKRGLLRLGLQVI